MRFVGLQQSSRSRVSFLENHSLSFIVQRRRRCVVALLFGAQGAEQLHVL